MWGGDTTLLRRPLSIDTHMYYMYIVRRLIYIFLHTRFFFRRLYMYNAYAEREREGK